MQTSGLASLSLYLLGCHVETFIVWDHRAVCAVFVTHTFMWLTGHGSRSGCVFLCLSRLLVQELLPQSLPQRRPQELFTWGRTFQITPSLAESGASHVTPSAWSPIVTCLYPGLWPHGAMDRPQRQPVFLTFVSAPAASLITSSALTTGDIVGFSSNVPSLTQPPRLD